MENLVRELKVVLEYTNEAEIAQMVEDGHLYWQESGFYGTEVAEANLDRVESILKAHGYCTISSSLGNDIPDGYDGYVKIDFIYGVECKVLWGSLVMNMTPHDIALNSVFVLEIKACGEVLRANTVAEPKDDIMRMKVYNIKFGKVSINENASKMLLALGERAKKDERKAYVVVSSITLQAMTQSDVKEFVETYGVTPIAPYEYIRDDEGKIVAIKSLQCKGA